MSAENAVRAPVAGEAVRVPVYVWDIWVRVIHWAVFFCFIILAITGSYISHPFIPVARDAYEPFLMGTVRVVHFYTAMVFDLAVFARIVLMFVGSPYARWDQFIPVTKRRWNSALESLKFYVFLRRTPPEAIGHDALDGLIFAARFLVDLLIIATGFALYSKITSYSSPLAIFQGLIPYFGGLQSVRWLHHMLMWVAILFILQHVIRVIVLSTVKHDGTVESMLSGYRYVTKEDLAEEARDR